VSEAFRTVVADPPWPTKTAGRYASRHSSPRLLPYRTMSVDDIKSLPVTEITAPGAHLWLWVTNQFLREGFDVMEAWGFTYLAPITWVKPSGFGNYFVQTTEHILFGYKGRCRFTKARYLPTSYTDWGRETRGNHSVKPYESYQLIERVSEFPALELFARPPAIARPLPGWTLLGDGVDGQDVRAALAAVINGGVYGKATAAAG
jgi:N6-adenosine-specific RNA methylase IME4